MATTRFIHHRLAREDEGTQLPAKKKSPAISRRRPGFRLKTWACSLPASSVLLRSRLGGRQEVLVGAAGVVRRGRRLRCGGSGVTLLALGSGAGSGVISAAVPSTRALAASLVQTSANTTRPSWV